MAITLDGTTGITTPGLTNTGTETLVNLTTTGNTILGDASTDTLNVGNGGLVKDASGNVGIGTASPTTKLDVNGTITALSVTSANTFGFKNRIINGAMVIDQRNAGASYTQVNGQFSLDRWSGNSYDGGAATNKFSVIRSTTAPTGFSNSLLVTSLAATASSASNIFNIEQKIEGFNFADFLYGTASAQTLTLSFWVRSSLTGTFGGALKNSARDRAYPFTYTISAANTFEQKTITIAGDTTGTWVGGTNGVGLWISFGLGVGTSFTEPANLWGGGDQFSADGCVSVVGTNGATWYISGVQLEKGSTATSFDVRDYGRELILCQRYYQQNTVATSGLYGNTVGQVYAGTNIQSGLQLATPMRSTPSASIIGTIGWTGGAAGNASVNLSSFGTIYYTAPSMQIGFIGSVASSQTGGYNWAMGSSAGGGYSLSSEF
jgi:hypothetical protein